MSKDSFFAAKSHLVGRVQSFGFLIGLQADDQTIQFFSENIFDLFPGVRDLLGKKLEDFPEVFRPVTNAEIYKHHIAKNSYETDIFLEVISIAGIEYHFSFYRQEDIFFLQIEKLIAKSNARHYVTKKYEKIQQADDADKIWSELLIAINEIIDYDHLMIYKFLQNGAGKIIAEKQKAENVRYLDVYYQAQLIPDAIKEKYLRKRRRIFSDLNAETIPVIGTTSEQIDLGNSAFRTIAQQHRKALIDNNILANFSTSIIVSDKLWGIVICNNFTPKHIDLVSRVRAEIFTTIATNTFASHEAKENLEANLEFDKKNIQLKKKFLQFDDLEKSLFNNINEIKDYPRADGLAIIINGKMKTAGQVPSQEDLLKIIGNIREHIVDNFYFSNEFNKNSRDILGDIPYAAGIIVGFPDLQRKQLLIWFRKEFDHTVRWAIHPSNIDQTANDESQKSVIYEQNITGKSSPWKKKDIIAAKKIATIILETSHNQSGKIRELNEELIKLNEELDSFSYSISHDLGTPLTVMKLNAQLLERSLKDNPKVQQKIQNILQEIDGMEMMMRSVLQLSRAKSSEILLEKIETEKLLEKISTDVLLSHHCENTKVIINECPPVIADRTMLTQVFQNIIDNAVKYSSKVENPIIVISGKIAADQVIYKIRDNGIGIPQDTFDKMFKIFSRMDNAKPFQGNGVGLSIVNRIMNRLQGSVTFENNENDGVTFVLTFRNPDY